MLTALQSHEVNHHAVEEDDSELFGEDFAVGYVKSLLRAQGKPLKLSGRKDDYDIYLAKTLYPVLLPAVEALSKEYDRQSNDYSKKLLFFLTLAENIDDEIRRRFNPCIFLAEYLMRNNPKHGTKLEYEAMFVEYVQVEKIRRFFLNKHRFIDRKSVV